MDTPNYKYSLLLHINPRVACTLSGEEYLSLTPVERTRCVDLDKEFDKVNTIIIDPDINRLVATCHLAGLRNPSTLSQSALEEEAQPENSYICFSGAKLLTLAWEASSVSTFNPSGKPTVRREQIAPQQLQYLYGVYWVELTTNYESHAYVIYLREKDVVVMNSYGGYAGFYQGYFTRESYFSFFYGFYSSPWEQQVQDYHLPWGFRPDMVEGVTEDIRERKQQVTIISIVVGKIY